MKKIIHNITQGSDEWKAHRRTHFNVSDAPAMLGISPYKTRSQLIQEFATGVSADIDASTQKLFDDGHAFEAMARPIAEEIIGEELYPMVVSLEVEGLPLGASLDGATMGEDILFEHKSRNKDVVAALQAGIIPELYAAQMEQQLLIMSAEKCLFMVSNGTPETELHAWYESNPAMRASLLAGWKQFKADVAAYKPQEYIPAPTAEPVKGLPALIVDLAGEVKSSNLAVYRLSAEKMIASINTDLKTDQDFANADNMVKFCADAEKELDTVKALALGRMATVEEVFKTIDHIKEQLRQKRLELDKLVTRKKESIRLDTIEHGKKAFAEHIAALNTRLGKPYMPLVATDFAGVIKGKRTIASLNDAVDTELARAKIDASAIADKIDANLKTLREQADGYQTLFPDTGTIVLKSADDLAALISVRITAHKEAEAKRIADEAAAKAKLEAEALARAAAAIVPAAPVASAPLHTGTPGATTLFTAPAPPTAPAQAFRPDLTSGKAVIGLQRGAEGMAKALLMIREQSPEGTRFHDIASIALRGAGVAVPAAAIAA